MEDLLYSEKQLPVRSEALGHVFAWSAARVNGSIWVHRQATAETRESFNLSLRWERKDVRLGWTYQRMASLGMANMALGSIISMES